ncbi:MAG: hypothetical protein JEZ07_13030 [Phycisphaerae bacterium]|nr:hypothetical protein [Phycisphaerae bacterium]
MSHYITAKLSDGSEIEFCGGISKRTLSAMTFTGFNIYSEYSASFADGGCSEMGMGKGVKITNKDAREAFQNGLAWALAIYQRQRDISLYLIVINAYLVTTYK